MDTTLAIKPLTVQLGNGQQLQGTDAYAALADAYQGQPNGASLIEENALTRVTLTMWNVTQSNATFDPVRFVGLTEQADQIIEQISDLAERDAARRYFQAVYDCYTASR